MDIQLNDKLAWEYCVKRVAEVRQTYGILIQEYCVHTYQYKLEYVGRSLGSILTTYQFERFNCQCFSYGTYCIITFFRSHSSCISEYKNSTREKLYKIVGSQQQCTIGKVSHSRSTWTPNILWEYMVTKRCVQRNL